ncbi:hypothetical protein V5799_011457 [Amblyomma americanum]|uniref:eIF-4F 25 kDa subunit n=1 Tax=Amblyomma americanum TaxID=6943 RepID=A0AAQ4EHV4_AMBAM
MGGKKGKSRQKSKQEKSKPEQSKPEQSKPEQSKPEQSKPEQSKQEQSKPEQSKPEQPEPEQSKQEQSKQNSANASPELPLKHPLEHRWSLWYYKDDKRRSWEENLVEISSFDTVEDFWALYHHVELPGNLRSGCDYSFFKTGIKPMWEDCRNKRGGRWLFNFSKNQGPECLNDNWLEVLLCLIGEGFDEFGDDVCGAVVQVRNKLDKISVWTADVNRADGNIHIGKTVKEIITLPPRYVVRYHSHVDTQSKSGSMAKARYEL